MSTVEGCPRELIIRTEPEEGDQGRLTLKDVGIGFTPEAVAKLVQAFYSTKNNGMGIGMHVSQSIIEGVIMNVCGQPIMMDPKLHFRLLFLAGMCSSVLA